MDHKFPGIKNRLFATTFLLAFALAWLGCNKSGKLDEASTSKAPAGPVELKLKWPVGERLVQEMDLKQNMEIFMAKQPAPMKQTMSMSQQYGLAVLRALDGGGHEVEMEIMGTRMKMESGGKTMLEYDSEKKLSNDKNDPMSAMFGKLVGAKIRYFLDASNGVERVEGIDDFMKRVTSGSDASSMAPLKSMMNEGYFKQMMMQNQFVPPQPVQPGDTWPVRIEFPLPTMGTLVSEYTFTFQSWEMHGKRNCARLDFQGTITSKEKESTPAPAMVTLTGLKGTSTGTSWFDPEIGTVIDTAMKQDMTMEMTIGGGQKKAMAQSLTNHMIQEMTVKMISVK